MTAQIRLTKDLFLWSLSVIYLFAFASLFVQIPGLYGDKGILPARLVLENEAESFYDLVASQPTLLRLLPKIGLDVQTAMDFLCLGGVVVAFVAMVSHDCRNCIVFAVLWAFNLSLFQVGQTFVCYKWDLLLLEAGFVAMIVAPLNFFGFHDAVEHRPHDPINMWLVKWLLFRLTFASGVVKLLSNSVSWWSLTALKYNYESQLLPTPVAWVFYQFPDWWHRLGATGLLVIQILISFFFFSPSTKHQRFALGCQLAHMVILVLTGNFGFYPLLVLALAISLADDDLISNWVGSSTKGEKDHPRENHPKRGWQVVFEKAFLLASFAGLLVFIFCSFSFSFTTSPLSFDPEIIFSPEDLDSFLLCALPVTIGIGSVSLFWQINEAIIKVLSNKRSPTKSKAKELIGCVFFGVIATSLFSVSLVPHTAIRKDTTSFLPEKLQDAYVWTSQNYHLANPYNLFLKANDEAKGRYEIAIEGSNRLNGTWKEYNFRYKPSDVTSRLAIVAPHQPRLDTQMWFAARGTYDQNTWFLNLIFRLLKNQKEVLELMDVNPFPKKAPKYIRAVLYRYNFATKAHRTDKFTTSDWWVREPVRQYLPPITITEQSFVSYLMDAGLYADGEDASPAEDEHNLLFCFLETVRSMLGQGSGNIFCVVLVVLGFVLTLVDPGIRYLAEGEQLANGISSQSLFSK